MRQPNEMLGSGITYGQAAVAVADSVQAHHGVNDDHTRVEDPENYRQLMERCPFLEESIYSGLPYNAEGTEEQKLAMVVRFVEKDLFESQMATLYHAICDILSPPAELPDGMAGILERMRDAADLIDDSEDGSRLQQLNRRCRSELLAAVEEIKPITQCLSEMEIHINEICDAPQGPINEKTQEQILLEIERLAFLMRQDEWAMAHGFRNPNEQHGK